MDDLLFHQFFDKETSTYTYLFADQKEKQAMLIDPVKENVEEYLAFLEKQKPILVCVLETHVHADHVTGAGLLRKKTGCKIAYGTESGVVCVDILLDDGDQLELGSAKIHVIATPYGLHR